MRQRRKAPAHRQDPLYQLLFQLRPQISRLFAEDTEQSFAAYPGQAGIIIHLRDLPHRSVARVQHQHAQVALARRHRRRQPGAAPAYD
ncbi:hypothetical protein SDC9_97090 [bioreactor metagenome]|uniref:Uncharacterized protein n=1 Tax=bioreactor metagenome TaxID=1076179 RepID=A0A645ADJ9_9ZZZZ